MMPWWMVIVFVPVHLGVLQLWRWGLALISEDATFEGYQSFALAVMTYMLILLFYRDVTKKEEKDID
jgi:hypothetical protein